MKNDILYKIVWRDTTNESVKGFILKDEPYTLKIKAEDGRELMIGKSSIVKVIPAAIYGGK